MSDKGISSQPESKKENTPKRIPLTLVGDSWVTPVAIPAGSALHYWDGAPKIITRHADDSVTLTGKVDPHVHLAQEPASPHNAARVESYDLEVLDAFAEAIAPNTGGYRIKQLLAAYRQQTEALVWQEGVATDLELKWKAEVDAQAQRSQAAEARGRELEAALTDARNMIDERIAGSFADDGLVHELLARIDALLAQDAAGQEAHRE